MLSEFCTLRIIVDPDRYDRCTNAATLEDRSLLQARMALAVETLRAQQEVDAARVAVMGFCFGGLCALDLARSGSDVRLYWNDGGQADYRAVRSEEPQFSTEVMVYQGPALEATTGSTMIADQISCRITLPRVSHWRRCGR